MNAEYSIAEFHTPGIVSGILVLGTSKPAFAIPLIKFSERSNVSYVQVVDQNCRVSGFSPVFIPESLEVRRADGETVEYDGPEVFAFLDAAGRLHVGDRKAILPIVKENVRLAVSSVTRLALAEFASIDREINLAAKAAVQELEERFDLHVAERWFCSSIIFRRVVDQANLCARSESERLYVQLALDQLEISLADDRRVDVRCPPELLDMLKTAPDEEGFRKRLSKLSASALGRPAFRFGETEPQKPLKGWWRRGANNQGAQVPDQSATMEAELSSRADAIDAELRRSFAAPNWRSRWRDAWLESQFNPVFERLAFEWIAEGQSIEAAGGVLADLLLPQRERVPLETLRAAGEWLDEHATRPQWGKVWRRYSHHADGDAYLKPAIEFLQVGSVTPGVSHREWSRAWRAVIAREFISEMEMYELAERTVEMYGNRARFVSDTLSKVINYYHSTERVPSILMEWLVGVATRGQGWAELFILLYPIYPTPIIREQGFQWLRNNNMSSLRWGTMWLALARAEGVSSELLELLPHRYDNAASSRSLRLVWDMVESAEGGVRSN